MRKAPAAAGAFFLVPIRNGFRREGGKRMGQHRRLAGRAVESTGGAVLRMGLLTSSPGCTPAVAGGNHI